jgi:hypothetical protein
MQVSRGQAEILGQDPVAPVDAQGCTFGAVGRAAGPASPADPTVSIDLAYYALAQQGRVLGLVHHGHELVAQHALEAGVAAHDL